MAQSQAERQKAYRIRSAKKNQVKAKVVQAKRDRRLSVTEMLETEYCIGRYYFQVRKGGDRWVVGPDRGPCRYE